MNLIFAVIFATFAFSTGVPYTPCEVGGTLPGSPAWTAGIEPGSRIVQIGEGGPTSEHLRFDWDLRNAVAMAGGKEDVPSGRPPADGAHAACCCGPWYHRWRHRVADAGDRAAPSRLGCPRNSRLQPDLRPKKQSRH